MDPINYTTDVATPFASAAQGFQLGAAIQNNQLAQQQLALQQQQQAQAKQVINSLISNPNAGAKDYANATLLVPGMREQFKQAWDTKNADQQQSGLNDAAQWFSAVKNGQPQLAVDAMNAKADAMTTAGAPQQEIDALRAKAQVIQAHPEFGRTTLGMFLASIPGGDKVLTAAAQQGTDQRAEALAPSQLATSVAEAKIKGVEATAAAAKASADLGLTLANTDNLNSQIANRSAQLGLDRDKLLTETQLKLKELGLKESELPEYVAKDVNAAAADSVAATQSAAKLTDLASRIDGAAAQLGSGVTAKAGELWKQTFGDQNELTRIRSEYGRIVTQQAMAAYKKVATGSTSDKDIDTALLGVPKDTADPTTMATFLRGAAKLQVFDSVVNDAKTEWLQANHNLGKASKDLVVNGVKVPAGTSFTGFTDQYVAPKVQQINASNLVKSLAAKYAAPAQ